ncbi:MAG: hypothetical protein LH702_01900 [Phormidesmis sp. CAN_BIN44]|nr:hypothetical protein [Phormidesmis sp. CAN_BIN44]
MTLSTHDHPFAQEFITDASGQVRKVIIDIDDYQKLIDALEDEGLHRAMAEVRSETPMNLSAAIDELERS